MSIGEYLYLRLFGERLCSVSMASATGLLNQQECYWDSLMLSLVDVPRERLPELVDAGDALDKLRVEFTRRWPALARSRWFPPIGDGACGNVGSGCVTRNRAAINIGTSAAMRVLWEDSARGAPPGLWLYRADRRRIVMGGALSNAGDLFAWFIQSLRLGRTDEVEAELAPMGPDEHGLTFLPFLSGERSTGWHDDARGVIAGLTLDSSPIEILRAGLEAVAYRLAAIHDLLAKSVGEPDELIASGAGALASPEWTQIICDVLGRPVKVAAESEASSRGAVLMALEALGVVESIESVDATALRIHMPRPDHHARYVSARARHETLYVKMFD
jgi:gluconokinase